MNEWMTELSLTLSRRKSFERKKKKSLSIFGVFEKMVLSLPLITATGFLSSVVSRVRSAETKKQSRSR